jgi:hypothetical protein
MFIHFVRKLMHRCLVSPQALSRKAGGDGAKLADGTSSVPACLTVATLTVLRRLG